MAEYPHIPYAPTPRPAHRMCADAHDFYEEMRQRRSVRSFSDRPVPRECIEYAVRTACTAPSGAHMQPWTWVAIDDPALKRQIRVAAEEEERESYGHRMSDEWRQALAPLGTDWRKPFLERAPYLVICFEQRYGILADGQRRKHYYVAESVGIACGLFIAAIHHMGLVTLTHTPSPMGFLSRILQRPPNERPYIVFPVGYPAEGATVPDIRRKPLDQVLCWNARPAPPAPGHDGAAAPAPEDAR
jgi:iodotyrosine deiodinase